MQIVQPIRSVEKLETMKTVLRRKSERDSGTEDGKMRRLPINAELREIINEYIMGKKDSDPPFPSYRTKQNIGRVQAYRILNRAAAEVGLSEIGTHTLRETFGYHFYKRYKDVALLQQIFNHSAPSITLRYIGINQDIIDEVVGGFHL
ncbi:MULTISPECIES: tyrosine-type recombinase/integrase [Paenibacillus]|uniref:tyrosine-type recombinase/integrase n=1 Tax=Paenibacillus TaxID=44249 RepID=UPI0022B902E9|nr:tyrosine-type recombinase/integrase [Paenibacillus caseinilyticus]MCZ8518391.1 tyrosine-type recombinase/integrase [Paenibacillus caseinilyticus]